jgi:hypothetical protein
MGRLAAAIAALLALRLAGARPARRGSRLPRRRRVPHRRRRRKGRIAAAAGCGGRGAEDVARLWVADADRGRAGWVDADKRRVRLLGCRVAFNRQGAGCRGVEGAGVEGGEPEVFQHWSARPPHAGCRAALWASRRNCDTKPVRELKIMAACRYRSGENSVPRMSACKSSSALALSSALSVGVQLCVLLGLAPD